MLPLLMLAVSDWWMLAPVCVLLDACAGFDPIVNFRSSVVGSFFGSLCVLPVCSSVFFSMAASQVWFYRTLVIRVCFERC